MTSTQLRSATLLADSVARHLQAIELQQRSVAQQQSEAPVAERPEEPLGLRLEVLHTLPRDFGPSYAGRLLRFRFLTGWSRGTLLKGRAGRLENEWTFTASFPNTHGSQPLEKTLKLRAGYYSTDSTAEPSSWHLLEARPLREAQAESDEAVVASVVAESSNKRQRMSV